MSGYVVPTALATPDDLTEWTGTAPANATALLRSATSLVLDATKLAVYCTDDDTGLPTDVNVLAAMRDATCIQAAAWVALKIDPLAGGIDIVGVKTAKHIGSAGFTVAGAEQAAAQKAAAASSLVPEAVRRLRQQGLISTFPRSR
jgi:hypothetical protein